MKRSIAVRIATVMTIFALGHPLRAQQPRPQGVPNRQPSSVSNPAAACCVVTAIDSRTAIVTATQSAAGRTFEFQVPNPKLLAQIRPGTPIYANFSTKQVSLDGRTPCCVMISGPKAAPAFQAPSRAPLPPAETNPSSSQAGTGPLPGQTIGATTALQPANAIRTLAVRVITGAAGSCDQVWFSIGPLGWKLDNAHRDSGDSGAGCVVTWRNPCIGADIKHAEHESERQAKGLCMFAAGADDTYELPIPAGLQPPYLTTDDIILLGLQKKGIGGLYNAPDSTPGGWGPQKVTLLVNGAPYPDSSCCIGGQRLHHGNATWVKVLKPSIDKPYRNEEVFVRSLRLIPNPPLDKTSEDLAFLTTKFGKDRGISGWLAQPIAPTCAIGKVIRAPGISNDGLATIDLSVDKIETTGTSLNSFPHPLQRISGSSSMHAAQQQPGKAVAGAVTKTEALEYILDGEHGIGGARYLRVEYAYHGNPVPKAQDQVRICGEVYRDTDLESWFEIHPRDASDVAVLSSASSTPAGVIPVGPLITGKTSQQECREPWRFGAYIGVICRGNPAKPAFLLFHGLHQSAESWTKPSSTAYNFDYRHTPKDSDLGTHSLGNAGVYKVGKSDILDVDQANWFDFLAQQGYTVATWSQPGSKFDPAYASAQDAFAQFLSDTASINPPSPPPIVLLGHSRGGLLIRKLLKDHPEAKGRVRWAITLHTPHQGSQVAIAPQVFAQQTSELFDNVQLPPDVSHPLKELALVSVTPFSRMIDDGSAEMAPGSVLFGRLEAGEGPVPGVNYYTFGGTQPTLFRMYTWLFTPMSAVVQFNPKPYFDWQVKAAEVPFVSPILDKVRAIIPEIKVGYGDSLVTDQSARLPASFNAIHHTDQLNHAEVLWNSDLQHQVVAIVSGPGRNIQLQSPR